MIQKNNLSMLGFGCMRLPDNYEKSEALILQAIEKGVNYFDVAYIYPGKEALLGRILHENKMREKVAIATKLPLFLCKNYTDMDKIFNKQLSRLKTDYIDYYLLHMLNNPGELEKFSGDSAVLNWLVEKQQSGKIRKIGFSFHGNTGNFIKLIDCFNWDFSMIQYNYLDVNNQAGAVGLKYAYSKNIPVIIMEPLRGGALAVPKRIPSKALKIFNSTELTPAQWALRWLWNQEEISCVLSGMKNIHELNDNLKTAESSEPNCMSHEELAMFEKVTAIFKEANMIPCTGCNYCMPCPVGVNIPGCFSTYNDNSRSSYMQNTGAMLSPKGAASGCINCGKCEPLCPQSIPIRESLRVVSRKMEPWWFKLGMPIVRRFTSGKKKKSE